MFTRVVRRLLVVLAVAGWCLSAAGATCLASDAAQDEAATHDQAAAAGHGGHGQGGGVNPLDFKSDLAIWTGVVFLVLLAVLWKFAWGPIAQGLDRREQGIADQISRAEDANRQAQELLGQYQEKLAGSQDEVREILAQARRDAEQVGRKMLDDARAESQAEHKRALREIEAATAGALKELGQMSATLAVELAGKIVSAELTPDSHSRLINQAVASFAQREPGAN